ncbi:MAG: hypothetical protein JNK89_09005 [Saprospiraceae bacterium]|nr:hypothetical protein [Saprospiraceae bacterium]
MHTIVETLREKGFPDVEEKPTAEISDEMLGVLEKVFKGDLAIKQEADKLARPVLKKDPVTTAPPTPPYPPGPPAAEPPPRKKPNRRKKRPK